MFLQKTFQNIFGGEKIEHDAKLFSVSAQKISLFSKSLHIISKI